MNYLDFTAEETNLIAIYAKGGSTRADVTARIAGALPYMDKEMQGIAARAAVKLASRTDGDFAALSFVSDTDEDGGE